MRLVLFARHARCRAKLPVILVNNFRPRPITRCVINPCYAYQGRFAGCALFHEEIERVTPVMGFSGRAHSVHRSVQLVRVTACALWPPISGGGYRLCCLALFSFPLSMRMVEDILTVRGIMVSHEMIRRIETRSYVWRERALSCQIRFTTSRTPVSGRTVMDMVGIGKGCVPSSKRKRATRVARMM